MMINMIFFLLGTFLTLSHAFACDDAEYILITKGSTTYNTTIEKFCADFKDSTGSDTNDVLVLTGNILLFTTATLGVVTAAGATLKYRPLLWKNVIKPLSNHWINFNASSLTMEIDEILPLTMNQACFEHLKAIDEVLSGNTLEMQNTSEGRWNKFPIYGHIGTSKSSLFDYITCKKCRKHEAPNYLYGFRYENRKAGYSIEIKRHFSVKPPEEVSLKDFYRINTIFQKFGHGIKKDPAYSPLIKLKLPPRSSGEDEENPQKPQKVLPHLHLNSKTISTVDFYEVSVFIRNFLKNGNFLKDIFPLISHTDNPFNSILKLYELKNIDLELALIDEKSSKKGKNHSKHLYFLWPTYTDKQKKEEYKIVLHIEKTGDDYASYYKGIIPDNLKFLSSGDNNMLHFTCKKTPGRGDCGFEAIDAKRNKSLELLSNVANNDYVRKLVAPEIVRSWRENLFPKDSSIAKKFSELGKEFEKTSDLEDKLALNFCEEHGLKEGKRKTAPEILENKSFNSDDKISLKQTHEEIKETLKKMLNLAEEKETYLAYLELFKSPSKDWRDWLVCTPTQGKVDQELETTGLYDAIAYLKHFNLYIWQHSEDKTILKLTHWFEENEGFQNVHVLHNGRDHYDKLKCVEEKKQREIKEIKKININKIKRRQRNRGEKKQNQVVLEKSEGDSKMNEKITREEPKKERSEKKTD